MTETSPVPEPAPAAVSATAVSPEAANPALPETPELVTEGATTQHSKLGVPRGGSSIIPGNGPTGFFLGVVSIVSLVLDIWSKAWAEKTLQWAPDKVVIPKYFGFRYAQNRGGAWGLLQTTNESIRRPFFLLVSVAAIAFIMSLYRRLHKDQHLLKWGLPLVLGGALGNVFDRIRYGYVIDFIDVHAMVKGEDKHWPTFNVADIAICIGVALMALDMFTAKKAPAPLSLGEAAPAAPALTGGASEGAQSAGAEGSSTSPDVDALSQDTTEGSKGDAKSGAESPPAESPKGV